MAKLITIVPSETIPNGFDVSIGMLIGHIFSTADGFYQFFPTKHNGGYWPAWMMRELADWLDEKNAPWQAIIEKELS